MEKYYVWEGNTRFLDIAYDTFDDAFEIAMNNDCVTEIEKTVWNSEEAYQNYEPADEFETVWKRGE